MAEPLARVFYVELTALSPELVDRYREWLSSDEREKAGRMKTPRLETEYVVTRALCRWVLSRFEPTVHPSDWQFARTEAGRPYSTGPRTAPAFNLSHGGGLVVCVVSESPFVGVDVEPLSRGDELLGTAKKMFSLDENEELHALAAFERARRAVDLWTTKEAYLKARGEGISVRLTRFGILAGGDRSYALGDVSVFSDDPRAWQLEVREVQGEAEPCVIAVAVRRDPSAESLIELTKVVPA
jgi:4'-phosphopantetheinyl transferase